MGDVSWFGALAPCGGGSGGGGSVETAGMVYVPHIDERKILTFTVEESPTEVPGPVDLNPFDEWSNIDESEIDTGYVWEPL